MKKVCLFLFLLLLVGIGYMSAQVVIGGRITSKEDGQPVPYVVISVKGSTKYNALSDDAGKYTISLPSSDLTLTYSMVGFITKEIKLSGQHVVDVVLDTDSKTLDDVIVVAYGTARKSTFTGSASNLSASAIKDVPTTSFENALSGRIPGLKITQGSGQAGSTSSIRIRGTGSMNASNEPLYVIDGVPVTSGDASQLSYVSSNVMNSLNPNDIENITVLKDAAASSLYGSRAANGVILITTKRGKAGKAKVNLKMNVGFTPAFATKNLEIASPEQQAELMYENRYNEYIDSGKTEAEAQAWAEARVNANIAPDPRGFYSWEDVLLRTASYQDYDVSVSGGTEATSYYTSLGYTRNDGRMVNNDMNRFSGRLNLTQKISPIVSIGTNVNFSNVKKTGFNDTRNTGSNYFYAVRNLLFEQWWPTDENGDWVTSRYPSYAQNYLYYDKYKEISSKMMKLSAVETATVNILPELQFKTIFSYDLTRIDDHEYYAPIHYLSVSAKNGGSVSDYSTRIEKIVSSNTLSYNKTFNSVHNVGAVIGYEAERNKINYSGSSGVGLPNNSLSVVSAAGTLSGSAYFNEDNMISYLSKVDYNYADRYYLAGSFRRDGSSRFGSNNRWGNFWSVSGSWRLIQEEFMSGIEWLSNLRVRASYGVNGTMPTNRYGHLSLYSYGYNYNASAGGALVTLADPNLSWESNYTSNFGIESSFLDNRLNFNVEYYNRTTKDLLQDVQTSKITGFTKYLANIGQINNKGFEFELSGDIVRTKDLTLNAGLNLSTLKSKVVKLNNGEDVIWYDPTGDNDNQLIYREGYSPLSFYGYEYAGVNSENGKPMWYLNNDKAGDLDVNGRAVTYTKNDADYVIIGCADPDFYGGFYTGLTYKGIGLNMNLTYSFGGDTYDMTAKDNADDGYYSARLMTQYYYDNRWLNPGDVTDVPRRTYDATSAQGYQSRNIHSGDYIRLKDVTLSYRFDSKLLRNVFLSNARIYASATNLLTWAAWKEYDPEVNAYGTRNWSVPIGKTITFGVELEF